MNEALEKFFEKYGDFGKTDKYYGNMHQVLAGQVYTGVEIGAWRRWQN